MRRASSGLTVRSKSPLRSTPNPIETLCDDERTIMKAPESVSPSWKSIRSSTGTAPILPYMSVTPSFG